MERNRDDKLGIVVKDARNEKKLTREQVAEQVYITPRYLMSIENENKKPSYNVLFRLVRVLGIPADDIFYPENKTATTDVERLIRLIYECDERDICVLTSTAKALLDSKK